jgi:hypothetical protein
VGSGYPLNESLVGALDTALSSKDPLLAVRVVAQAELAKGSSREALLKQLEQYRQLLQAQDRERDEDIVLEVMDQLTGFCSPGGRL